MGDSTAEVSEEAKGPTVAHLNKVHYTQMTDGVKPPAASVSVDPRFPAEAALYLTVQDKCSHAAGSRAWEPALLRIWIH